MPLDSPSTAPATSRATNRRPLRDYLLPAVGAVCAIVLAVIFLRSPEKSEWHRVYFRAAERMQRGEPINVVEDVAYAYPPAMALLTVPLTWPGPFAGMCIWYLVNMLAAGVVFTLAWRLAGGPSLVGLSGKWFWTFLIGCLLCLRFVFAPLEHQQFDMVIAALLMLGCAALWRGATWRAGAWWGAAAAMKCTPLLFAPYLIWRRQFGAAAALLAVAVGLNVLPDLLYPQSSGHWYAQDWLNTFVGVAARGTPGAWFVAATDNQSLAGVLGRWGSTLLAQWAPATNPAVLRWIVYAVELGLLGITLWRFGGPLASPATLPRDARPPLPPERLQVGVESAAVICLMLLLSPMTSKAHLVVMLLPCLLIARFAIEGQARGVRWLIAPLIVFGPLSTRGLLASDWGTRVLLWGFPVWYVLTALVCLWVAAPLVRAGGNRSQELEVRS